MTPDERGARVESLSHAGGPLDASGPHASINNPAWFNEGQATPERRALHDRLLDEHMAEAPAVRSEKQAVIIAGPPGAGKSMVREDLMRQAGTTPQNWRHIDHDAFRDRLATAMLADGSLEQIVPPQVAGMQPTPRELTNQLFKESGKLATRAQNSAIKAGENLMIEGAYNDPKRLDRTVQDLAKKGYDVHIATVDISPRDALARTRERYRRDATKAMDPNASGPDRLGGRVVPAAAMAAHFDERGRPVATAAAEQVAGSREAVKSVFKYRVDGADQPARLAAVHRRDRGFQPIQASTYETGRQADIIQPTAIKARPEVGKPATATAQGERPPQTRPPGPAREQRER